MKLSFARTVIAAAIMSASASAFAADITGAGSTFIYPILSKWADAYKTKTGVGVNYQSIGSGGGIKQVKAKTVDFGASDKPLNEKEQAESGLTQFPAIMGGIVPVVNLEGVANNQMKLTGPVLAEIFMGKITMWNDPKIVALNKGVKLPATMINVVHRSDGSGTTFNFTNYLGKVSPEWQAKVGSDTSVAWPVGTGGKGNEGVANFVKQIKGSIGYVETAYAKQNNMISTQLQNKDGVFVSATAATVKAAAAGADWDHAPGFYEILTNEPGKNSWPITATTFVLMHKQQATPAQAAEALKFFSWSFANGDQMAESLDYIPMPESVVKKIESAWKANIKGMDGKAVY